MNLCLALFLLINIGHALPALAGDLPDVAGVWTCSEKDCHIEIYPTKQGTWEARLLWSRKEMDEAGNPKLDVNNPDPAKRHLPVIGSKTLWGARYNPETGYFEEAQAYRNGRYFCGKFKLEVDGSLSVTGYLCSFKILRYTESWTRVKEK